MSLKYRLVLDYQGNYSDEVRSELILMFDNLICANNSYTEISMYDLQDEYTAIYLYVLQEYPDTSLKEDIILHFWW